MFELGKRCALILPAILTLALSTASAQAQVAFDQPGTTLTGRLLGSYVMVGSGKMLKGRILHLDVPISISANEASEDRRNWKSVGNVDRILLKFEVAEPTDDMFGGAVLVTGRLINEPSDPFHTEVAMLVADAVLVEASDGEQPVATFKTH